MKLTILGTNGTFPGADRACSGYLIESGETKLLMDCGTGVLANLQKHISPRQLTHVIISHLHPDHFIDLVLLRYALTYGYLRKGKEKPILYLPPNGANPVKEIMKPFIGAEDFFSQEFEVREYSPKDSLALGNITLRFILVPHYVPAYAISVSSVSRLVYSADTGPSRELTEFTRGADLFLCEASLLASTRRPEDTGHVTAGEAAKIAQEAGVAKLVLTHIPPYVDRKESLKEATTVFTGPVEVAEEGAVYDLAQ